MFDAETATQADLLERIASRNFYKHVVTVLTIDVSQSGWVTQGGGGEGGRFDYEGNGLLIVPTFMRANDLFVSQFTATGQHGIGDGFRMFAFMNTRDNPGIPMGISATAAFGNFSGICCTFNRFYLYVDLPQTFGLKAVNLAVLKGLDLSPCASSFRNSGNQIIGCYSGGQA